MLLSNKKLCASQLGLMIGRVLSYETISFFCKAISYADNCLWYLVQIPIKFKKDKTVAIFFMISKDFKGMVFTHCFWYEVDLACHDFYMELIHIFLIHHRWRQKFVCCLRFECISWAFSPDTLSVDCISSLIFHSCN